MRPCWASAMRWRSLPCGADLLQHIASKGRRGGAVQRYFASGSCGRRNKIDDVRRTAGGRSPRAIAWLRQQWDQILRRSRLADQIALDFGAAFRAELPQLLLGFDAFGRCAQTEAAAESGDRSHDGD